MPTDGNGYVEDIFEEFVAQGHLVDDVLKMGGGLIVHAKSSIDKFQLTIFNQILHYLLFLWFLLVPLFHEIKNFDINEFFIWVTFQGGNNGIQN